MAIVQQKASRLSAFGPRLVFRIRLLLPWGFYMNRIITKFLFALSLGVLATLAVAHDGSEGLGGGLLSGFLHPIFGWDHVVAMVAVGLWGAFLGSPALWILPVVFPLVMALGGALGVMGIPVPAVELGIALSAIVLGLMVAFKQRPSLWIAGLLVAVFAIFHGHAHGTELPTAVNPLAYSLGFMVATGMLHMAGIGFGLLTRWPAGERLVQILGGLIALTGLAFLTGVA